MDENKGNAKDPGKDGDNCVDGNQGKGNDSTCATDSTPAKDKGEKPGKDRGHKGDRDKDRGHKGDRDKDRGHKGEKPGKDHDCDEQPTPKPSDDCDEPTTPEPTNPTPKPSDDCDEPTTPDPCDECEEPTPEPTNPTTPEPTNPTTPEPTNPTTPKPTNPTTPQPTAPTTPEPTKVVRVVKTEAPKPVVKAVYTATEHGTTVAVAERGVSAHTGEEDGIAPNTLLGMIAVVSAAGVLTLGRRHR